MEFFVAKNFRLIFFPFLSVDGLVFFAFIFLFNFVALYWISVVQKKRLPENTKKNKIQQPLAFNVIIMIFLLLLLYYYIHYYWNNRYPNSIITVMTTTMMMMAAQQKQIELNLLQFVNDFVSEVTHLFFFFFVFVVCSIYSKNL